MWVLWTRRLQGASRGVGRPFGRRYASITAWWNGARVTRKRWVVRMAKWLEQKSDLVDAVRGVAGQVGSPPSRSEFKA
jgi:hypothetical protein